MFQRRDGHHFCVCLFIIQFGSLGGRNAESTERVIGPVQEHLEQSMAENNFGHSLPQQTRSSGRKDQGRQTSTRNILPRLCQLSGFF